MAMASKSDGAMTPVKESRSRSHESSKCAENFNPNVSHVSPNRKPSKSPVMKSAKYSVSKNLNTVVYSPQNKIRQRKFMVAKKHQKKEDAVSMVNCKCKEKAGGNAKKCLCVAYESLRASPEEFFKNRGCTEENHEQDQSKTCDGADSMLEGAVETSLMIQDLRIDDGYGGKTEAEDYSAMNELRNADAGELESPNQVDSSTVKRRRARLLEEARNSVPESGSGRVLHLVKAFEKLLSIPTANDSEQTEEKQPEEENKVVKWALPGLQPPKAPETDDASTSFFPSDVFLTSKKHLSVPSAKDSEQIDEKQPEEENKVVKWALPGLQPPKAPETVDSSTSFCPLDVFLTSKKLLSVPSAKDSEQIEEKQPEEEKKVMKWTLPGLQPPKAPETEDSSTSLSPSDVFSTSEYPGLNPRISVSSSWDSSRGSCSISSRTSTGSRRSRRKSFESSGTFRGRRWKKKQLKVTSQKPFKLRTEQRGKLKNEEFVKKIKETMVEEEKQRIPIAQGLPWTTDEPECLLRRPVKESTRPIDLKLHSDLRAIDRAGFDYQVAEKMTLIEQYKMERERQQKLAEEEEIRRLRKELIPKAQPMPYFDRPFIPRRSMKHPTIPREPKFQMPQHKIKCCLSWNCSFQQGSKDGCSLCNVGH